MKLTRYRDALQLDDDFPIPLDAPFTATTAHKHGICARDVRWLVAHQLLRRILHGVYADARLPDTTELRCRSLALVVPPDAVVCDRHAGWIHGAPMVLQPGEHQTALPIAIYLPTGRRLRNKLSDSGERTLRTQDIVRVDGLAVTTPLRTAWDLGRARWTEPALSGLDAMLRTGTFTRAELVAGVEQFKGMRWVTTLRALAPLADGRAESPGESALRLRWLEARVPAPTPQLPVWADGELLGRLDLGEPDFRYGAEYDGAEWHTSMDQRSHDQARRSAMLTEADFVVDAFVAADVYGRGETATRRIRQAMEQRRPSRPEPTPSRA